MAGRLIGDGSVAVGDRGRGEKVVIPGFGGWVLVPFDDALLLEAERWIAQRSCRFYPDVLT